MESGRMSRNANSLSAEYIHNNFIYFKVFPKTSHNSTFNSSFQMFCPSDVQYPVDISRNVTSEVHNGEVLKHFPLLYFIHKESMCFREGDGKDRLHESGFRATILKNHWTGNEVSAKVHQRWSKNFKCYFIVWTFDKMKIYHPSERNGYLN